MHAAFILQIILWGQQAVESLTLTRRCSQHNDAGNVKEFYGTSYDEFYGLLLEERGKNSNVQRRHQVEKGQSKISTKSQPWGRNPPHHWLLYNTQRLGEIVSGHSSGLQAKLWYRHTRSVRIHTHNYGDDISSSEYQRDDAHPVTEGKEHLKHMVQTAVLPRSLSKIKSDKKSNESERFLV